jgi:hypothetical protein
LRCAASAGGFACEIPNIGLTFRAN